MGPANGLRGNALFTDLYDNLEEIKGLINWCGEWSVKFEDYISKNIKEPEGWRRIWGTNLPEKAVFVNGDPTDLIKCKFLPVFDKIYAANLFETLGGGFFHHHSLGLHQVDQVASTKGILAQEIFESGR